MKRYLSWGLGVQSTWMLVMSALGELEPIDAAIVADTQWEQQRTRDTFEFYSRWFEQRGIKIEVVTGGNMRALGAAGHTHIPFWTESGGPLNRQCTGYAKIVPIKKAMRRLSGYDESLPPHPKAGEFENWIGISWDEWSRMSTNETKYITNRYPLIEKKLNRWDCVDGYKRMGLPIPTKSACIGCPYRDAASWLDMRHNEPESFEDACKFDEENRHNPLSDRGSTADAVYVWRGLKPLREVDFATEAKKQRKDKQTPLFVCTGQICWT